VKKGDIIPVTATGDTTLSDATVQNFACPENRLPFFRYYRYWRFQLSELSGRSIWGHDKCEDGEGQNSKCMWETTIFIFHFTKLICITFRYVLNIGTGILKSKLSPKSCFKNSYVIFDCTPQLRLCILAYEKWN